MAKATVVAQHVCPSCNGKRTDKTPVQVRTVGGGNIGMINLPGVEVTSWICEYCGSACEIKPESTTNFHGDVVGRDKITQTVQTVVASDGADVVVQQTGNRCPAHPTFNASSPHVCFFCHQP